MKSRRQESAQEGDKRAETPRKCGLTVTETADCPPESITLSAGPCLVTGSLAGWDRDMGDSRSIVFANFCGVNAPTKANFKPYQ